MENIWQELLDNLTATALVLSLWAHFHPLVEKRLGLDRISLFGVWMGASAILSMMLSFELAPGIYADFRNAIVSMSGLFGGPVAAVLTSLLAGVYRYGMGGDGVAFGLLSICVAGGLSAAVHLATRGTSLGPRHILAYALTLSIISTVMILSPLSPLDGDLLSISLLPVSIMGFISTVVAGLTILAIRNFSLERDLLRAALKHSPDFYYIKDRQSRFRVVNHAVAQHHGFETSGQLIGLTDLDVADGQRAWQLLEEEQAVMDGVQDIVDKEEKVATKDGERWFSTSKTALRDESGHTIGLAGVTHDITARKMLERELEANRNLLAHALREMSDGLAMFDPDGRLVFCNQQYLDFFPITAPMQKPGTSIRDILEAAMETGEALDVPEETKARWIEERVASLRYDNEQEVKTSAGLWLVLRTRVAKDGSSLVVVADHTAIKQAEFSLQDVAAQLRVLAETDGLTGLTNRRFFDAALGSVLGEARETNMSIALILLDIDRFKAYNDHYGHSAGDRCLRIFTDCLKQVKLRTDDVVARYGGEEFAVLLPQTDEAGAMAVAERIRDILRAKAEPHLTSERGVLSASIGVAVVTPGSEALTSTLLVNRADAALYQAKADGRDCVRLFREAPVDQQIAKKAAIAHPAERRGR